MNEGPVQVEVAPQRTPWFLPAAIMAVALLLVAVFLSRDSVAPIDLADDPGPIVEFASDLTTSTLAGSTLPPAVDDAPVSFVPLREMVPGFDQTLHLWVRTIEGDRLLIWSDPLVEPRQMDLPDGTTGVDLNAERLKTLVVTENGNGMGVLWLGDRTRVEPALIFDSPIDARWHASRSDQLAVTISEADATAVLVYDVQPGSVLVEAGRFEVETGRAVEWFGEAGISLRALNEQPVAEWLTFDGHSTTYSRHLIQPGGRPIFDICTGVPCRPTARMYVASDGSLVEVSPEVVQVTHDGAWEMIVSAAGVGVRRPGDSAVIRIPISGLNAWSSDSRWMVFDQEAQVISTFDPSTNTHSNFARHGIGFLNTEGVALVVIDGPDLGTIEGIWLP